MDLLLDGTKLELLLDQEVIARRVRDLGARISADYRGRPVRVVGILKGAWIFLSDLVRALDLEVTIDFLSFTSYGDATESSGTVKITKDPDQPIAGLDVLVVEDILDTGKTFEYLLGVLEAHKPRSIKVVTLLDKPARRVRPVRADYVGFTIPDVFVVGYGLDCAQRYRNLSDIRIIRHPGK